jgi:hypothetical protein
VKKSLQFAVCIIVLCSLLVVPLSLRSNSSTSPVSSQTSQAASQSSQQNQSQLVQQATQDATSNAATAKTDLSPVNELPETGSQLPQLSGLQAASPNDSSPCSLSNRTLQQATADAINYIESTPEPYALLLLNVLYRQFGITEFADSLQRYDQILAANPENAPLLRIFRRIANYSNTVQLEDFYAVTADVDKITVPALYSDRGSLPDDYMSKLNDAALSGGYMLTHALLATIWLQDNHCDPGSDFREKVYHANAALIDGDPVVTDLELEAAAFLYISGQGTLVDNAFVQNAVVAQNYDGGWSFASGASESSNWHASVLGLFLLLYVEFPALSHPSMLASDLS